jgi:CO dehydrogenase/acetyl-CoA synthase epsilon subunit
MGAGNRPYEPIKAKPQMTITRRQAETELVRRAKKKMLLVGMNVTTDGDNDDLSGVLAFALRAVGIMPVDPITVTDSDLGGITDNMDEFLDRAELRLFENIEGNIDLVDIQVGQQRESLGQLAEQLKNIIKSKREAIASKYKDSEGLGTLSAGSILLDFAQKGNE